MASVYERHRITLDEYHRMVEAGVFAPDARLELIEGELIAMPPIDPPHASTVDRIVYQFFKRLAGRAWVRCQHPVTLPSDSEPEPDIVLARLESREYSDHHPAPEEILLAVEVAESTLKLHRKVKIPLYARSGIREVWLVDLVDNELMAYREPNGAWYRSVQTHRRGDSISPLAFPDVTFAVADLLPKA